MFILKVLPLTLARSVLYIYRTVMHKNKVTFIIKYNSSVTVYIIEMDRRKVTDSTSQEQNYFIFILNPFNIA